LLHLIDAGSEHAGASYKIVRNELEAYGGGISEKPEIVALSKVDTVDDEVLKQQVERLKRAMRSYGPPVVEGEKRRPPMLISAAAHQGVTEALRGLIRVIDDAKAADGDLAPVTTWQP
jgi:GTPase